MKEFFGVVLAPERWSKTLNPNPKKKGHQAECTVEWSLALADMAWANFTAKLVGVNDISFLALEFGHTCGCQLDQPLSPC
jgi:hypothetical protein